MSCDLEQPSCYREIRRRARNIHRCGDCKGEIKQGEFYLYISGIWEGTPENYKRCPDCQHIRCEIKKETGDEACLGIDALRTWLEDYGYRPPGSPWCRWVAMFNVIAAHRGAKHFIDTTPDQEYQR